MRTYSVYFCVGDKKLKKIVSANSELEAFDKVKESIVLVAVKEDNESVEAARIKIREILSLAIRRGYPDLTSEELNSIVDANMLLIKTEEDCHNFVYAIEKRLKEVLDKDIKRP